MYTMGIDVGSASSKSVILKDGGDVVAEAVIQAGTGSSGPSRVVQEIFEKSALGKEDIGFTVATGYGRFSVEGADKQISEITCHGRAIAHLCPNAHTIIDIGGQDAKAILLDDRGNIAKFFMNDKCAAGTGRFLEVMAKVLEVDLEDMEKLHFLSEKPASVSSTCTVFAESEVISLLSQENNKNDIIAGVHKSVSSKACGLAYRAGVREDIVMCGGVARNAGVVDAISKELGKKVIVAPHPQVTGALGAALLAYEELKKKEALL
ncbi:2-hydroxyglutaryl-CoA dehydratase [Alphaproteobacteria bacterium]|nr:2-hydroxyglutaryl-CoA dehydratase [Alphaproteobacteria bacterium]